jgi:ectoine hydroxylase-related dioxygenase (phytanoyl-CoA dioxygenase family)
MSSVIRQGEAYSAAETQRIVEAINCEGYCHLGQVLEADEVAALKDAMERKMNDPKMQEEAGDHIRGKSLMRMFEYDNAFRDLIVREPFASLAETILGADCHLMSQNALFTDAGAGEDIGGWHVDDLVHFPLPEGVESHDRRIPMACLVLQIFTPLTDVEVVEYGPTQVVPGSHYAGRRPDSQDNPTFAGREPVSLLARAGDAYLFNNQIWHRGGPNRSDRNRFLGGVTYSKRFISQRFYPFIDYQMPEHVWQGADERLQRMLGRHDKGAYG